LIHNISLWALCIFFRVAPLAVFAGVIVISVVIGKRGIIFVFLLLLVLGGRVFVICVVIVIGLIIFILFIFFVLVVRFQSLHSFCMHPCVINDAHNHK
jgi:hypothetical protein